MSIHPNNKSSFLTKRIPFVLVVGFYLLTSTINAQCTWTTIDFDDFEGAGTIPFVNTNHIYGSGTHSAGAYNGGLGLWLNVQNGFPTQLELYNRPYTVCPNQSYQFTGWFGGTSGANYTTYIYDGTNVSGTPIATYNSFSSWNFQTIGPLTPTSTTLTFVIRNNIAGGVGLNDFQLDDLSLQLCEPTPIDNPINLCTSSPQLNLFNNLPVAMGTTGIWSGPSALTNGYLGTFDQSTMTAGTYTYTIIGSSTCPDSTNTVTITITAEPDLSATNINLNCGNISADLTNSFVDNNGSGGTVTYWQDASASIPEPNPTNITTAGTYYIVIDINGCTDTASISITMQPGATIDLGNDTSFCFGQSLTLDALAGFDHYLWNDNSINQTLTTSIDGTYWVQASVLGPNLVVNGNFSSGNTGYTTNYSVGTGGTWGPISNPGTYLITTDANIAHSNFLSCNDHTTGTGNMMVINGASIANQDIWCQTIPISANTDYEFSTWIQNYDLVNPAQLSFFINGIQIGNDFSPTTAGCTWQNFFELWNSGAATTAQICIVNQNLSNGGNDFSIDDISFAPLCTANDTIVVTVNSATTSTDTLTACNNFTWIDGINYTASNTTATDTIFGGASNGCDSIVTLNLTINNPINSTDIQTACNNFIWIDGINYTASNTTATDTIFGGASNGCDSIVTLNLTINSPTNGIDNQTACDSFQWLDGNTYTTSNSIATHTIINGNSNGCDSIVTLNLIINNTTNGIDTQTECGSFQWIDGNTYTTSNSIATHTIVGGNSNGCDSLVTLNLIINNATNGIDTQIECGSFQWIDGETYISSNSSANHIIVGGANNGCDSTVTLDLTILPIPVIDLGYTFFICNNSVTLDAGTEMASYLWNDGSTNSSFTTNEFGTYSVTVTNNDGCEGYHEIAVIKDCPYNLWIPNTFTPNNDGKNEAFKAEGENIESFSLKIYNRWGELLFKSNNILNGWDGTFKTKLSPTGIYTYRVDFSYYEKRNIIQKEITGVVTLVR